MNTLSPFVAALVLLPAIGVVLWARWMMQRAESALIVEAGLQNADFDIGTWASSNRTRAA